MNNLTFFRNIEFILYLLFSLLLAFFFQNNLLPSEDASILFRYSENFADTGIISYNLNEPPVEGVTDFLWMLILSAFYFIGIDTYFSAIVINLISLYFIIKLIQKYYLLSKLDFYLLFFFPFYIDTNVFCNFRLFSAICGINIGFSNT